MERRKKKGLRSLAVAEILISDIHVNNGTRKMLSTFIGIYDKSWWEVTWEIMLKNRKRLKNLWNFVATFDEKHFEGKFSRNFFDFIKKRALDDKIWTFLRRRAWNLFTYFSNSSQLCKKWVFLHKKMFFNVFHGKKYWNLLQWTFNSCDTSRMKTKLLRKTSWQIDFIKKVHNGFSLKLIRNSESRFNIHLT